MLRQCRNCKYWESDVVGYDWLAPDGEHGPHNCRVHLTDTTDDDSCNSHKFKDESDDRQ